MELSVYKNLKNELKENNLRDYFGSLVMYKWKDNHYEISVVCV